MMYVRTYVCLVPFLSSQSIIKYVREEEEEEEEEKRSSRLDNKGNKEDGRFSFPILASIFTNQVVPTYVVDTKSAHEKKK